MSEFHFIRPYWFIALLPLFGLIWYLLKTTSISQRWEKVCDKALLPYILVSKNIKRTLLQPVLTGIAGTIAIVALAGPTWERLPQSVFQKQSALVIVLDLSLSMFASDVTPSRIERARFKISDLLDLRVEGQTAMVVYAGDAFAVTPLTDDIKTIKSQLKALSPEIMPAPGSNTGIAITKAIDLMKQARVNQGHLLLVTDEVENDYEKDFIEARNAGYKVSVLAVGTEQGAPIKLPDGKLLEDTSGSIIIPTLNQNRLKKLSQLGGGQYQSIQPADTDIENLNRFFTHKFDDAKQAADDFKADQWRDFGPWLVILIVPFFTLMFRRGYLCILVSLMVFNPEITHAFEWDELWLNKDQRAMRALENKQAEHAAGMFQNKQWKAAAKYMSGDYAGTEELLEQNNDALSQYNLGNALAKQGKYKDAVAAYDSVLDQAPDHADAKYNREIILNELKKKQPPPENKDDNQDQKLDDDSSTKPFESDYNQQQSGSVGESDQEAEGATEQGEPPMTQEEGQGVNNQETEQELEESEIEESEESEENDHLAQQSSDEPIDEEQQVSEQWLRRIPDDPSGLLRRKFKYQYQIKDKHQPSDKYW